MSNRRENRTSATVWNSVDWRKAETEVRRLRQRIYRAEKSGNARLARSLQKLMLRSYSNRLISVRRVTQHNRGKNTPGVDKLTVRTPRERGRLVDSLALDEPWKPAPVRRVHIPKANGKRRPLGIPVIRDRALQAMVKNALEPQWEARFEACSYGFRPGRSTHDAIKLISARLARRAYKPWIIDADIRSAFDRISHDFLLEKIGDFPARELIGKWLKAGVVEADGYLKPTDAGTPQGGVISPLLANIALDGMEDVIPRGRLVRYADDLVVFCKTKSEAEEIKRLMSAWLLRRGLELSAEKTRIVHAEEGFDFLGFHVRILRTPSRKRKRATLFDDVRDEYKVNIRPAKRNQNEFRHRIREAVRGLRAAPQGALLRKLAPIVRGWANYYRYCSATSTFVKLDHYTWWLLWRWAKRRHPRKGRRWLKRRYWGRFAPGHQDHWVFGEVSETGTYHLSKMAWTRIEKYHMVAGDASPEDPDLVEYWDGRRRRRAGSLRAYFKTLYILQKGLCPHCGGELFNGEELHRHHVVPLSRGGKDHWRNMQLVHLFCHQQVHAISRRELLEPYALKGARTVLRGG